MKEIRHKDKPYVEQLSVVKCARHRETKVKRMDRKDLRPFD